MNIRSLNKNIDQLRRIVNELRPNVISLCEIFKPHAGFVGINGYHKIIMKNRIGKNGGGVVVVPAHNSLFISNQVCSTKSSYIQQACLRLSKLGVDTS